MSAFVISTFHQRSSDNMKLLKRLHRPLTLCCGEGCGATVTEAAHPCGTIKHLSSLTCRGVFLLRIVTDFKSSVFCIRVGRLWLAASQQRRRKIASDFYLPATIGNMNCQTCVCLWCGCFCCDQLLAVCFCRNRLH